MLFISISIFARYSVEEAKTHRKICGLAWTVENGVAENVLLRFSLWSGPVFLPKQIRHSYTKITDSRSSWNVNVFIPNRNGFFVWW